MDSAVKGVETVPTSISTFNILLPIIAVFVM